MNDRAITPWTLFAISLPLAALAGLASWYVVEKPSLTFARRALAAGEPSDTLVLAKSAL